LNKSPVIQNKLSNTKQPKSLVLSETPIPTFSCTLPGKLYSLSGAVRSFQKNGFKTHHNHHDDKSLSNSFISYLNSELGDKIKYKNAITKTPFKPI